MARKPTKPRRQNTTNRGAATRSSTANAPPTLSAAHLQGFVAGCVTGVLASLGTTHWSQQSEEPARARPLSPPNLRVETGPRFDFYEVLPNQELDLNPEIEPADLQAPSRDSAQYLLQVGSFRKEADADRRRGELALLGLNASIEAGESDNGRWFRVYLGPFASHSEMARARTLTAEADMDTLLLKREPRSEREVR